MILQGTTFGLCLSPLRQLFNGNGWWRDPADLSTLIHGHATDAGGQRK